MFRYGLIVWLLLTLCSGWATEPSASTSHSNPSDLNAQEAPFNALEATPLGLKAKRPKNEWVLAPLPSLNPGQGYGLKLIAQYVFRPNPEDTNTPPSIIGVGGGYTQAGSWAGGAAYLGFLDQDRWRVLLAGGYGVYKYDFHGIGNQAAELGLSVPISQSGAFAVSYLLRRIAPNLYLGPRLVYFESQSHLGLNIPQISLPPSELTQRAVALGVKGLFDTRENIFSPYQGSYVDGKMDFYRNVLGSNRDYEIYDLAANHYRPIFTKTTLAMRLRVRLATGEVPFYALSQMGSQNDLRGYELGKYRDRLLLATQAEARYRFATRWSAVAFAGIGEVAPSVSQLNRNDLLTSVGAGIRFLLSPQERISLRLDWAYGKDGSTFYISVGEAF